VRLFFLTSEGWSGGRVTITGQDVHHIRRVLRLKPGDLVSVADGGGRVSRVRVESICPEAVEGLVVETEETPPEEAPAVTLAQGIPKGRKMELIVQKSVELGVERIVPLATARTVVRLKGRRAAERLERWRRVAREAAKQCRRSSMPQVSAMVPLETFLEELGPTPAGQARILLWEEASQPLKEILASLEAPTSIICMVGPEGGFEAEEVALAADAGFSPASLGPRILRTETAPLALLAVLLYAFGGP
jgi:16S rRNA (uracil1498-N3)-methyltransferase